MLFMGKIHYFYGSMAMFNSFFYVYQAGFLRPLLQRPAPRLNRGTAAAVPAKAAGGAVHHDVHDARQWAQGAWDWTGCHV